MYVVFHNPGYTGTYSTAYLNRSLSTPSSYSFLPQIQIQMQMEIMVEVEIKTMAKRRFVLLVNMRTENRRFL